MMVGENLLRVNVEKFKIELSSRSDFHRARVRYCYCYIQPLFIFIIFFLSLASRYAINIICTKFLFALDTLISHNNNN